MDNDKGRASDAPPVNDWPYETRSLVEAPGYERIEQHAVAVLNWALDLGRAVACRRRNIDVVRTNQLARLSLHDAE